MKKRTTEEVRWLESSDGPMAWKGWVKITITEEWESVSTTPPAVVESPAPKRWSYGFLHHHLTQIAIVVSLATFVLRGIGHDVENTIGPIDLKPLKETAKFEFDRANISHTLLMLEILMRNTARVPALVLPPPRKKSS